MFRFKKITSTNGFDTKNIENAKQNSYAWCMTELGDYIYVGTSRNMLYNSSRAFGNSQSQANIPSSFITGDDNSPEIWRYKKDDTREWQKVFKTDASDKIFGFRAMITHKTSNSSAIYTASAGEKVSLYKSIDGLHWIKIDTSNVNGTSSRALASLNGKLYMATLESGIGGKTPYLYVSSDPEINSFKLVIDENKKNFIPFLNPMGGIDSLSVFNNKLYVGISTPTGAEIWRSETCNPKNNKWILISDRGFGDSLNTNIMSTCIFKDNLYVSVTKQLPLSLFLPLGFDLIKIDKDDNWDTIVGGKPIVPSYPTKGKRSTSISSYSSGFNNFFNIYGWQIAQYKDNLIITTYDGSTNIKTILEGFIYNKDFYINQIGSSDYCKLINCYNKINNLLSKYSYPKGFDIYSSKDGCEFTPVILNGLNNPNNYGGRTLYATSDNKLYLGTANPYDGLEVWKVYCKDYSNSCSNNDINSYYSNLKLINNELIKIYPSILPILYDFTNGNF